MTKSYLRLRRNEDKRLRRGHLWVFSNEVDISATPLNTFLSGELVVVEDSRGQALGLAYVNPASLIAARLISHDVQTPIDRAFFATRLRDAAALRSRLYSKHFYRLIHGESDGLPGLIVDRFGDVFVVQINTAGMERLRSFALDALEDVFSPRAIVVKNSASLRQMEGLETLPPAVERGELPAEVWVEENGARFSVDALNGQKTGWFFDHRENRARAASRSAGFKVLDLFAYTGAWSIPALMAGAKQAVAIDSSASALAMARRNAEINGCFERFSAIESDVFDYLNQARLGRERFDLVILDPPALIKRKKDYEAGLEAYRRLNRLALQVLAPEGFLVSASCSYHLPREKLHDLLRSVSVAERRHLVLIGQGGQGADHPVHPAIPETDYLKFVLCAVRGR